MKTPQQRARDTERTRLWKQAHPERARQLNAESLARNPRIKSPEERQRDVQRAMQWAKDNPERAAELRRQTVRRYHAKHPERVKRRFRTWIMRTKYGLTPEQYDAKLAAQNGGCCICETKEPGGRGGFHIDHDHVNGKVRGLLCMACNIAIGKMKDSPELLRRAATYIEFDKEI